MKQLFALLPLVLMAAPKPQEQLVARTGFYGPRASLKVRRPTIRWEVWADRGTVTDSQMTLDGAEVPAKYDPATRSLAFTPSAPLSTGSHHVECKVTFDKEFSFNRAWDAKILDDAVDGVGVPGPAATAAINRANQIRSEIHLPPFGMDARMVAAAQSHADYMVQNNITGHGERVSDPGFLGASPSERLEAYGWGGNCWEGISYTAPTAAEAVDALFNAPYHRLPFLQPGELTAGFGMNANQAVMDFEGTRQVSTVVSPMNGQQEVACQWAAKERPDPLRLHPELSVPIGYPIVVATFGPGKHKLTLVSYKLTGPQGEVACVANDASTDTELTQSVIVMPVKPLEPGTSYRFEAKVQDIKGEPQMVTSTFETKRK